MSSDGDAEKIIEKFDWNQLSLECLKRLQPKISKAIDLKIRDLKLAESTTHNDQIYGCKASLAKVFPDRLRNSLSKYQNCVFIVSLGSKNFIERKRLEACIQWISENFKACVVLVCDSIYRLTIEIQRQLKADEAWLEALQTGKTFIDRHHSLFEKYSQNCNFEFRLTSTYGSLTLADSSKLSDFKIYYEELQNLYQKNEPFQTMVNSFAQTYLNRNERIEEIEQKQLAITYIIEESALFACLAKEGWLVFIYPGSIKTFEKICEGLHPEVPAPLQKMIWVSLRLKRKAKRGN